MIAQEAGVPFAHSLSVLHCEEVHCPLFRVEALERCFQLLICPFLLLSYHRLNTAEVPCPEPILLRSHVLIMGFIGKDDM